MVAGARVHGITETVTPLGSEGLQWLGCGLLAPFLFLAIIISGRYFMDISIVATIGFTTAAVIGIIVLVFSARKGKNSG
jgi:hypothetical protein